MKCSFCKKLTTLSVVDSRRMDDWVYRKRVCASCGNRFTTYEVDSGSIYGLIDASMENIDRLLKSLKILKNLLPNKNNQTSMNIKPSIPQFRQPKA